MSDIYEYKKINLSLEPKSTIEDAANRWAAMGWRTVAVMDASYADREAGFTSSILVERKKEDQNSYNPLTQERLNEDQNPYDPLTHWNEWVAWDKLHPPEKSNVDK